MVKKTLIIGMFSLICFLISAFTNFTKQKEKQVETAKSDRLFKKAMNLAGQDNYRQAIKVFKVLLANDPEHLDALFNMGLCYLNTSNGADSAVISFNKGLDILTDEEKQGYLGAELGLSLGKAYQVLLKPLKAIKIYEELIEDANPQDTSFIKDVEREIQICHHANFFIQNPIDLDVKNLGSTVNSAYDDHSPLIAVSESELFFTSRRNWIKLSLLSDGQYAEKIYTVPLSANNWESARLLKVFFKQNEHEAAASLSPDGNQLVLFRNDIHGKSLYLSNYNGKSWSSPEKLPFPINSYAEETHGSISADKSTFFFTSDREGGFGGLDIYMVKRNEQGKWGKPRNLGKNINTPYDEETPMIHYDGKTLYFSSEGHNTMGRLDVFYSQMNTDSTWSIPVNMGYPINTPDDDFFFVPTINKSHAYYASSKFADNYGGSDIYQVTFKSDSQTELAVVEGKVDKSLGKEYEKMRILVTRREDNKIVGDYRPGPQDGSYMMFLETGYEYSVSEENAETKQVRESFVNVTEDMSYKQQKVPLEFFNVAMEAPLKHYPVKQQDQLVVNKEELKENESKVETKEVRVQEDVREEMVNSQKAIVKNVDKKNNKDITDITEAKEPNVKNIKAFINGEQSVEKQVSTRINGYTLQLLALKEKPLADYSFFKRKGLDSIQEYRCIDGFTRYTFGSFKDYRSSLKVKRELLHNNKFSDIWIRPITDFEKISIVEK